MKNFFTGLYSIPSLLTLISLMTLSMTSCGSGPKLTYCLSNPADLRFECHNQKTDKTFRQTLRETSGWTCTKPDDTANLLEACNRKQIPPKRSQCIFGDLNDGYTMHCFDQLTQTGFDLPLERTENYACLSVNDFLFLVDYCEKRRTGK